MTAKENARFLAVKYGDFAPFVASEILSEYFRIQDNRVAERQFVEEIEFWDDTAKYLSEEAKQ